MKLLLKEIKEEIKKCKEVDVNEIGSANIFNINYFYPACKISDLKKLMKLDIATEKKADNLIDEQKIKSIKDAEEISDQARKELLLIATKSKILKNLVEMEIESARPENKIFEKINGDRKKMLLENIIKGIKKQDIDPSLLVDRKPSDEVIGELGHEDDNLKRLFCYARFLYKNVLKESEFNYKLITTLYFVSAYELLQREILPFLLGGQITFIACKDWKVIIREKIIKH